MRENNKKATYIVFLDLIPTLGYGKGKVWDGVTHRHRQLCTTVTCVSDVTHGTFAPGAQ